MNNVNHIPACSITVKRVKTDAALNLLVWSNGFILSTYSLEVGVFDDPDNNGRRYTESIATWIGRWVSIRATRIVLVQNSLD